MSNKLVTLWAIGTLITSGICTASTACDEKLSAALHACEQIVGSLRPDKAAQMRVFAPDGSEFTAGQAQWMKAQLNLITKACADGDSVEANRRLTEVQQLLNQHHRGA
jgi:hypothetical protein